MRILCLYNNDCAIELFQWLESEGHEVVLFTDRLDAIWYRDQAFNLSISYTFRCILSKEKLNTLNINVAKSHNSILPFNRGTDPNLWRIIERTSRGVSFHYMDAEFDKGYIIAQSIVIDSVDDTLASNYNNLDRNTIQIFKDTFRYYRYWSQSKKEVEWIDTYHSLKNATCIKSAIDTYDLSINELKIRLNDSVRGGYLTSKIIQYSGYVCQVMVA